MMLQALSEDRVLMQTKWKQHFVSDRGISVLQHRRKAKCAETQKIFDFGVQNGVLCNILGAIF